MLFYVIRRFIQMLIVIAIVATIVFIFVNMLGDPAVLLLPPEASPEELAKARAAMGLDRSPWEQYKLFVVNVLHGDLGNSFVFREPAMKLQKDQPMPSGRSSTALRRKDRSMPSDRSNTGLQRMRQLKSRTILKDYWIMAWKKRHAVYIHKKD